MLVFISDLHISDRTTGVQFLELGAFAEALPNIARQAEQAKSKEITFIFLGDIFDMVRTTYWTVEGEQAGFWATADPAAPSEKLIAPWDKDADPNTVCAAALFLLQKRLLAKNAAIFDLWSQNLVGRRYLRDANGAHHLMPVGSKEGQLIWPSKLEPKRAYIPGNHDRIINQWPELRAEAIGALGLNIGLPKGVKPLPVDGSVEFAYFYQDSNYKVFGRHGQEWDSMNFEHSENWKQPAYQPSAQDYLDIPIGELIANEFSRLPVMVSKALQKPDEDGSMIPQAEIDRIVAQLNVLDDVRPAAAVVPWLFESLNTNKILQRRAPRLLKILLGTLDDSATRLENLPYMQDWMRRHNQFLKFDETEQVRLVLNSLQLLRDLEKTANFLGLDLYGRIRQLSHMLAGKTQSLSGDNYEQAALDDLGRIRAQYPSFADTLYILYGHTHRADQVPLTVPAIKTSTDSAAIAEANADTDQNPSCAVYLNTGTWRPLARQALNQDGFMRWKNLTFTLFYCRDHDPESQAAKGAPTFETWTGSLLSPLA